MLDCVMFVVMFFMVIVVVVVVIIVVIVIVILARGCDSVPFLDSVDHLVEALHQWFSGLLVATVYDVLRLDFAG